MDTINEFGVLYGSLYTLLGKHEDKWGNDGGTQGVRFFDLL